MFDLDDGLTIESYRVPWLIWIQILIFFLLIFLLFCFSVFTSDLSTNHSVSSSPSSSSASPSMADAFLNKGFIFNHNTTSSTLANRLHHNQVGEIESVKGEITRSTSRRILREENTESEGFSTNTIIDFHPCNYFRLAKLAFLKCFGLDPTSENSSTSQSKKER